MANYKEKNKQSTCVRNNITFGVIFKGLFLDLGQAINQFHKRWRESTLFLQSLRLYLVKELLTCTNE